MLESYPHNSYGTRSEGWQTYTFRETTYITCGGKLLVLKIKSSLILDLPQ
jgi:hypothetical protein